MAQRSLERSSLEIVPVGGDRRWKGEFIRFPKVLYRDDPRYVPAFSLDMRQLLARRHPFFAHSQGEFFLVLRGTEVVGRFLITENNRYNTFHNTSFAFFDFLDFIDDPEVVTAITAFMNSWAKQHGATALAGPMLSGGAGGAGVLVKGYEHTPAMTMMRYNAPYYPQLLEQAGFTKLVDLHSFSLPPEAMHLPERIERLAQLVLKRGHFTVRRFTSKGQVRQVVGEIKALYAATLNHHVEDYPLSAAELDQVEKELLTVVDPRLITLLAYDGKIVGYAFGFADLTEALQRNRGSLGPLALLRILREMKNTRKILFNGMGILPEYQRLGGNALLYRELAGIVTAGAFREVEMVQISEQTALMMKDAGTLGGTPFKVHRLYQRET